MLPIARRALLIGLVGPLIQGLGFVWLLAHLFLRHLHDPIDPRHLFFEGGFLTLGAGLLITLICVPVALEVARASEEEVALMHFEGVDEPDGTVSPFGQRHQFGASE